VTAVFNIAPCRDPAYHLTEVTQDATDYYLREGEAPGRWVGSGAVALGLAGEVSPEDLQSLFAGKHPNTGEYLISARGSAARSGARRAEATFDVGAAAARLAISEEAVRTRLRSGALAGEKDASGRWRISFQAIAAYAANGDVRPNRGSSNKNGHSSDGAYSLQDAARRAGVGRSYLARLVGTEPPPTDIKPDGGPVQYLVGARNDRGHWRIAPAELDRFMQARKPVAAVPAFDLAMRAPKSVSILHALGHLVPAETLTAMGLPANLAAEVVAAHRAAVDDAIAFLERHAAWVRGPGGRVQAQGFAVAVFDHRSSREGDPLLHSHAVIANVGSGVDGRRAALDSPAIFGWCRTGGHVYHARLRAELTRRLGVQFHEPHNGLADLVGVPRQVIDVFSQRRRQILEVMARLGTHGPQAAQTAALATRAPKGPQSHQTPDQLAARAAALGFGEKELAAVVGRGPDKVRTPAELAEIAGVLASPDGLTARTTRVDLRDAVCGFATGLTAGATGDELERWATRLLHGGQHFVPIVAATSRSSDVIRRPDGRVLRVAGAERTYSTPELLTHESALLAAHDDGIGRDGSGVGWGVAAEAAITAAMATRPTLSDEQAEMVRRITASGVGVEVVVGGPGSGKTFALGVAAEAWRASGFRVVGAALQGGASVVLAEEADLSERHTLTGLLARCDREGSAYLDGVIAIVDEASMADTRQLSRLARYAAAAESKLVLVGDPDQIPEVGAGGAFAQLVERCGESVVAMRDNRRQRHPADRERLELIRDGYADEAIASAQADGRWHDGDNADDIREALLRAWHDDPGVIGTDKLMIATTVAEVEWLNRAARAVLVAEGHLGAESLVIGLSAPDRAVDSRDFRVGDRVRATRNLWSAELATGQLATVIEVDADRVEVTVTIDPVDDGSGQQPPRVVTLGSEYLNEMALGDRWGHRRTAAPGLTHAYASTANAVQGRTAERAYVLAAEAGLYRQAAYTAASRAASETHYFAVTVPDVDELERHGELLPADRGGRAGEETAALARAMSRDGSQTMASALDPSAVTVGELMARPPAWLWAERNRLATEIGGPPPLPEAARQVRTSLADTYHLPLEALECRPLTDAIGRALQVSGATPERVSAMMLGRHTGGTRELRSAEDPIAVLVWAAGDYAVGVLTAEAEARGKAAGHDPGGNDTVATDVARQRIRLLDDALARQRDARLAMVETEPNGPISSLLGPLPDHAVGRRAWRRAAAATLDYRDRVGMFDRDGGGHGGWVRALGQRPDDHRGDHYDQVRAVVIECRATSVLAELAHTVPKLGPRPALGVATLAERPLHSLDSELESGRRRQSDVAILTRMVSGAERELKAAEKASADAGSRVAAIEHESPPGRQVRRSGEQELLDTARLNLGQAQAAEAAARARLDEVEGHLHAAQAPTTGYIASLQAAIAVREARFATTVLADPPAWVRTDVTQRVAAALDADAPLPDPSHLANAYVTVAVAAEHQDQSVDLGTLADNDSRFSNDLRGQLEDRALYHDWATASPDLDLGM